MRLQLLGTNRTLLTFQDGTEVFFSYETPVAGLHGGQLFRTDTNFSATTNKMIGEYFQRKTGITRQTAERWPQARIDQFLGSMTK